MLPSPSTTTEAIPTRLSTPVSRAHALLDFLSILPFSGCLAFGSLDGLGGTGPLGLSRKKKLIIAKSLRGQHRLATDLILGNGFGLQQTYTIVLITTLRTTRHN